MRKVGRQRKTPGVGILSCVASGTSGQMYEEDTTNRTDADTRAQQGKQGANAMNGGRMARFDDNTPSADSDPQQRCLHPLCVLFSL